MQALSVCELCHVFSYLPKLRDVENVAKVSLKWRDTIIYTQFSDDFLLQLFTYIKNDPLNDTRLFIIQSMGEYNFNEYFCYYGRNIKNHGMFIIVWYPYHT